MEKFGCTTPFGYNLDNICTDNVTGKQAFDLYDKISNKRYTMKECPYPCKFVKFLVISLEDRAIDDETFKILVIRRDNFSS